MQVVIGLPSHGGAYRGFERCLGALLRAHPEWKVAEFKECPCVDISRAAIAEGVIRERSGDVILWLDADMTFSVETCETIVREAWERQTLVGCVYSGKKFGAMPQCVFPNGLTKLDFFEKGSVVEVEAIGFGVVAHPVAMLETIAAKCELAPQGVGKMRVRPWFTGDPRWESMHSDDYCFCRRARQAGFKLYADTRQRVGHIGFHTYHLEDSAVSLQRANTFRIHFSPELGEGVVKKVE